MARAASATFVHLLEKYGLLETDQLKEVILRVQEEPRVLAWDLHKRGWLTSYQVEQLVKEGGAGLVLGSYILLEQLGGGGMGRVYKARHQKLGRIVALKVINPNLVKHPTAALRFQREIQAVAQLDHPNIVLAYDAEEDHGTHLLAMEFVEGTDLGRLVKMQGPLPVLQACNYVRQAALGLQHAFEKGLVHRDIKPSNLLLGTRLFPGRPEPDPVVKVLDLGVALLQRPIAEEKAALTLAGAVVGTIDYMAPEQAQNASGVDIRADLYSLGCTFYYLVTGQVPFPGATATNKLFKHALEEPTPVEQLRPELPLPLAAVIRRLMAKKPEDRFQTPAQLAQVLETFLQGRPAPVTQARVVPSSRTGPPPLSSPDTATFPEMSTPPLHSSLAVNRGRRLRLTRWQWVAFNGVGLALFVVLVGLLVALLRGDRPAPTNSQVEESSAGPESPALLEWERLRRRQGEPGTNKEQLWQEVLQFRHKFAGTPQALQAAVLLHSMPSPLDVLKREKLPPPLLFEPRPLEVVARLTPSLGRGGASQGVVFSPDGRHLLQLRKIPPGAILWDVATGKDLRRFESAKEEVRCAAFSPSGHQALLGSSPPRLSIWDVAAGTKVGHLDGHTWAVTAAAWSPDGNRALSGSRDRSVRLWNLAEKKLLHTFEGHEGEVTAVAFSPDGLRAFSASTDKTLRCWDLTARQERLPRGVIQGPVACLGLLPDGKQAVAGGPKGLHSWSLDPLVITNFLVYEGPVSLLAVSGDGQLLAAGNSNGWLGVWNLASGQKLKERRLLPPLSGLSFAADCRHLAASWGMGQVSIFRLP